MSWIIINLCQYAVPTQFYKVTYVMNNYKHVPICYIYQILQGNIIMSWIIINLCQYVIPTQFYKVT